MSDEQPAPPRCKHDYGPPSMCPLCKADSELAASGGCAATTELRKAYDAGKLAAKEGRIQNPYSIPLQRKQLLNRHASWRKGWLSGKRHNL